MPDRSERGWPERRSPPSPRRSDRWKRAGLVAVEASQLGASAARALLGRSRGRVEHAFRRAAYVKLGPDVLHLAAPGLPVGPLTARLRAWRALAPGQWVGLDWSRARVWSWTPPPPAAPRAVAAAVEAARASLPRSSIAAGDLSDLEDAASRLAGVGPGLTPEGDDVLAGVLLSVALTRGDVAEAWDAIAPALGSTTPISCAYVRAAARGECAEPVARVLNAALRGDETAAVRLAPGVARWGSTTGPALLAGFAAGLSRRRGAGAWADRPTRDQVPTRGAP